MATLAAAPKREVYGDGVNNARRVFPAQDDEGCAGTGATFCTAALQWV
ncbi:MAG: hypothetical protein ACK44M_08770 [Chloroflexus sp.]